MPELVLGLTGLYRSYFSGGERVEVIRGADLAVRRGERIAVMGASGCGKSTLLHLAGGMDVPDAGRVELLGEALNQLPEPKRTRWRARHTGLVFQDFNLIDSLTARDNIELALWLNRRPRVPDSVVGLADELGVAHLLDRLPGELSGGQQQRVAIARALIHSPALILADEPTGSLDETAAGEVMAVFSRAVAERGCALVLATHSLDAAGHCDRIFRLHGGRLEPA